MRNVTPINWRTLPKIVKEFNAILKRGLSEGVGDRNGQMCVEAAICCVLGEPHGDEPKCVLGAVRDYKVNINDESWDSPHSRAGGLRDVGIAQLGSKGVVNAQKFRSQLALAHIKAMVPPVLRKRSHDFNDSADARAFASRIAEASTLKQANAVLRDAIEATYFGAYTLVRVLRAAAQASEDTCLIAGLCGDVCDALGVKQEKILRQSAKIAYQVLVDLKSPGAVWLDKRKKAAKRKG